ncbi:MAG: phosphatidate cytidylyltransferase [Ruminococcaceae bacterium]|nr:phosphatidate cytidylyltransferase [Oscillospiraceae bacterium]
MKTRVISAIVMIALAAVLIYFGDIYFGVAIFLVSLIGLYEFYKAFKSKGVKPVYVLGYIYTLLIPVATFMKPSNALEIPVNGTNIFPAVQVIIMLVLLVLMVVAHKKVTPLDGAVTLLGAFYVPFLFSFFVLTRNMTDGLVLLIIGILGSVAADTFAIFAGLLWGKKKLIPEISPKKTIAGSVGSFVGSVIALVIYGLILHYGGLMEEPVSVLHFAILGLIMGGTSQIGDLSASAMKRYCGIKDFGKLIPGHGGILDRFDSMLFNVPMVYCYIHILRALS